MWRENGSEKNSKDLEIIKEWLAKQPHLPRNVHDLMLSRFLHCCNNSIEQTKNLIDLFYTLRSHAPEIFSSRDPKSKEIQKLLEILDFVPMAGTTEKNYKILIYRLNSGDSDKYDFVNSIKTFFMFADIRMITEKDIAEGEVPIFDMNNFTLKHLTKVALPVLKKYMVYTQEAHPIKLKQIHILNTPPFLDKCMALVKPFMKSEISKMIHFHVPGSTTLFEYVPKELLPDEYQGTAGKIQDLKEVWVKRVLDHRDYLMDDSRWKVDENLRPVNCNHYQSYGMEGSFRSLSID